MVAFRVHAQGIAGLSAALVIFAAAAARAELTLCNRTSDRPDAA